MLLEFSVTNFRSIRDKQTFSMVASPDKKHLDNNSVETGLTVVPRALRTAAIYGANAAGKSNLLKAIGFMRKFVIGSASSNQEGQDSELVPFAFDRNSKNESSHFEIHFIENEVRYEYGFRLTRDRVIEEWLNASPKGRIQKWFHREWNGETKDYFYEFGSYLQGLKQVWEKSTRSNALFLSTAIQLNSEQLKPVFDWFQAKLILFSDVGNFARESSVQMASWGESRNFLVWLMQSADKTIDGFKVEEKAEETMRPKMETFLKTDVVDLLVKYYRKEVSVFHDLGKEEGRAELKLTEESDGTQRLFWLAWPWVQASMNSSVLLVDELDASLHPLMAKFLIEFFMGGFSKKSKAQLIFTTHNTTFLNKDLFRRDQVWFAEKDARNSSCFYPLTDFSPRKDEAFEKGYLNGRYGALPYIGEFKF